MTDILSDQNHSAGLCRLEADLCENKLYSTGVLNIGTSVCMNSFAVNTEEMVASIIDFYLNIRTDLKKYYKMDHI